jgi:osmotically-inducible protein OsmY
MADYDRNWGNQSNESNQDWNRNRNRSFQNDESRNRENYGNYGNVNYGNDYQQNQGMRGSYGQSDYGGAYSSDYGSQYGGGYSESDYGNRNQMQNQGNWQNMGSSYGSQHRRESDWNRNRENMGSAGMYGGDFGREDWERGSNQRSNIGRSNYGTGNYGSRMGTSGRIGETYNRDTDTNAANTRGIRDRNYMGEDRDRNWWDRTRDEVSSWFGDDDAERRRNVDEQRTGIHRGKGPRGYHRSTERIREDVCDRLSEDDRLDASDIEVQIQDDEVILTGSVHSREDKRRAEDLAESISGVRNVENRLRVNRGEDAFRSSKMNTGSTSTDTTSTGTTGTRSSSTERNKNK